jgi:hypothetical protein
MIRRLSIAVTGATGDPGEATADTTTDNPINGIIRGIHLTYVGEPPAGTTDVVVTGATTPAIAILTVSNVATDGWFYPMHQAQLVADASDITNQGASVMVDDRIKVTITGANNADGVTAVVVYEDLLTR